MNAIATDITQTEIDPLALRDVLGKYATGVTVVTTLGDNGAPVGLAANSFTSVSLDPPLILWSLALKAPSLGAFREHSSFVINIMCEESKDLVMNFSRPSTDKFAGVDWQPGLDGAPVLTAASATLECETVERISGGDHEIYIGRVRRISKSEKAPLLFHQGQFAQLGENL
ncbi:flavin reductase family protein [Candidatus Halocynthiibacter alkanivorans]|jgi:flavin reductase (DIM6/NTAB) family NADH-FMN oxidoreductase RutF|uniref:flavin reductase family protein n=1 Tax=Candidatus Halocynthiibacter alkanivorans TaxID=2267619 RepID=UPI000DF389B0|nr:flavin reductase family protein [Candidatus Halocynthiibacter alkanivorans]